MALTIKSVFDKDFEVYGRVITDYDTKELCEKLIETSPAPSDGVIYVPSDEILEATPAMKDFQTNCYGGMPIEIGYCNGTSTKLNCFEYHRDSEIDVAAEDCILLLARLQDAPVGGMIDSSLVEAFFTPAGTAVELYATTLHYAPCSARLGEHFRVVIILPRGTNYDKPELEIKNEEDKRLWACNKWLIAHPDSNEASQGAVIGISGENIDIAELIK